MNELLQSGITLTLVAIAAGYLVRRAWKTFMQAEAGGCGQCAKCPSSSSQKAPASALVQLDVTRSRL